MQRAYEKDGQKRTVVELQVDEVAPSLRYATAKVTRSAKSGQQGPYDAARPTNEQVYGNRGDDPWGTGGGGNADPSEPPFAA